MAPVLGLGTSGPIETRAGTRCARAFACIYARAFADIHLVDLFLDTHLVAAGARTIRPEISQRWAGAALAYEDTHFVRILTRTPTLSARPALSGRPGGRGGTSDQSWSHLNAAAKCACCGHCGQGCTSCSTTALGLARSPDPRSRAPHA